MAAVAAGERFIVANLSQVSVMDHTGLGVLVNVQSRLEGAGGGFRVAAAKPQVAEGIARFRLEALLQPCATEAEALHQLTSLADGAGSPKN